MDNKLEKWIRWLAVVENEVVRLLINKDIFWGIDKMIKNNKNIQKPSSFYDYLGDTYIAYAVMAVRRQIKIDDSSISLARLLAEIIENPEKISREYYKKLYEGSVVERFADRDFDKFTSKGGGHISKELVGKDLKILKQSALRCEELADKRLAHIDKRKLKTLPTFRELDACIDLLDKLCVKYNAVFHAASMETLMPTDPYGWREIFRYPWLIEN